jgi:hypothetical protein
MCQSRMSEGRCQWRKTSRTREWHPRPELSCRVAGVAGPSGEPQSPSRRQGVAPRGVDLSRRLRFILSSILFLVCRVIICPMCLRRACQGFRSVFSGRSRDEKAGERGRPPRARKPRGEAAAQSLALQALFRRGANPQKCVRCPDPAAGNAGIPISSHISGEAPTLRWMPWPSAGARSESSTSLPG